MSRSLPELPDSDCSDANLPARNLAMSSLRPRLSVDRNLWMFRCCIAAAAAAVSLRLSPFGLQGWLAAGAGIALAIALFLLEYRLKRSSSPAVLGGALGGICGGPGALLVSSVVSNTFESASVKSFFAYAALLGFGYLGVVLGARKFSSLQSGFLTTLFGF